MPDLNPDEGLAELLKAISDGALSAEQHARLEAILRDDRDARATYVRYVNVDALLSWRYASVPEPPLGVMADAEEAGNDDAKSEMEDRHPSVEPVSLRTQRDRSQSQPLWRNAVAICVLVMLGFLVGMPLGWMLNQRATVEVPPDTGANEAFVATLVSVSEDTVWSDAHGLVRLPGEGLDKGWMRLDAGVIEMKFASGATVRVEGPAAFGVDSPLRGYLEFGGVSVHAPDEARDFVVGTATMEVVDLGTRFEMTIDRDSGETEVVVIEGLVDLHLEGDGTSNRIQSLPAGQSAKVNANGEVVRIDGKAIDPRYEDDSGLLSHWKLDDVGDDGHVADASGNELHGTLNGETRASSRDGKVGRALDLGLQGYVDLREHIPVLTGTPAFTLTAWVRDARDVVFSMSDGTPRDRIQFELHGKSLLYGWQQGDRFDHVRARVSEWERGRWYQVAVSVSGGNVTIYRDGKALIKPRSYGEVIGTRVRAPIDVDQPTRAYLGFLVANHAQHKQYLGGQLDDVQFYGRALDQQAIEFLYEHPGATYSESLTP